MKTKSCKINRNKPSQTRSKETVEAILTATAQVLTKEGFKRTTTNRIAERAGVSIGSLYQYFPNKESLVAELIERHKLKIVKTARLKLNVLSGQSVSEATAEFLSAVSEIYGENIHLHRILVSEEKISEQFETTQPEQEIIEIFKLFFQNQEEKFPPNEANMKAFIILQTIKSLIHTAARRNINSAELGELKTEMTNMLSHYLTPENKLLVF